MDGREEDMRPKMIASLIAGALLMSACASISPSTTNVAMAEAASPVPSADPRVKYKDGERYLDDLSEALAMPREAICKELGRYDCFADAFRIVLGGVEGPNLLVNEPLEFEALTAPIAYDRVALNVCVSRVDLDVAKPTTAVLFKPKGKAGRKPNKAWLSTTADQIYGALLRRDATPTERAQLAAFYDDVAKGGVSKDPAKDWTVLSCFAVATSLEAIFY